MVGWLGSSHTLQWFTLNLNLVLQLILWIVRIYTLPCEDGNEFEVLLCLLVFLCGILNQANSRLRTGCVSDFEPRCWIHLNVTFWMLQGRYSYFLSTVSGSSQFTQQHFKSRWNERVFSWNKRVTCGFSHQEQSKCHQTFEGRSHVIMRCPAKFRESSKTFLDWLVLHKNL